MTREITFKAIPPVPRLNDPALTDFCVAIKQRLEIYQGNLGTGSDVILRSGFPGLGELNVNADWDAIYGDAKILNKPTLGTSSSRDAVDTMDGIGDTLPSEIAIKAYGDSHWMSGNSGIAGPDSSIDSAISLFDGITGKLLKDSTRFIEDILTDGDNLPDGAAIKAYGDANWNSGGDVLGPSSNTDGYIPLWNGANSKTLADGIANNSVNWNTAYGWGNHSLAGYLTTLTGHNVTEFDDVSSAGSGSIISDAERTKLSGIEDNAVALPVVDTIAIVKGSTDGTKLIRFEVDGLTTATTRVLTVPDKNFTLAGTDDLHDAVTIGTANGLSLSTQVLSLAVASSTVTGALTSTNWTTFNNKQNSDAGLTSLAGLTYSSAAFVKMTGADTFSLDTNTYLTGMAWGDITGTLSNQADLQGALDGKEPGLGNPSTDGYILSSTAAGARSWVAPGSGSGDVTGPSSATNNHVVFFADTTGKLIKDSGLALSGSNTGDQDLSGLVPKTTTISTTSPLAGGGDLSANRTFSIGNLPISHLNNGTGADATTFWRGDGTWATPDGSGYTNLTQFVDQTAWRLFYSNNYGDIIELPFGTSGQYLKSNGSAAPTWDAPSGGSGLWTDDGTYYYPSNWPYLRLYDADYACIADSASFANGFPWDDVVGYPGSTKGSMLSVGQTSDSDGNPPVWVQKKFNKSSDSATHYAGAGHFEVWKQSGSTLSYVSALTGNIQQEAASGDAIGIHGRARKKSDGNIYAGWFYADRPSGYTGGYCQGIEVNVCNMGGDTGFSDTVGASADIGVWILPQNSTYPGLAAIGIGADNVDYSHHNGILFNTRAVRNDGAAINMAGITPQYGIRCGSITAGGAHLYCIDGKGDLTFRDQANGVKTLTELAASGGSSLWTDDGTYYYPNNWTNFKIYDSGKLDMASSQWVYDDTTVSYTPIGQGQVHKYNQLIKNHSLNAADHETAMLIEAKTSGSNAKNKVALMTAIEATGGSNQIWALNPLCQVDSSWDPGSGGYAIACEIDMNCNSPNGKCQGLSITGNSSYDPHIALGIGMGNGKWEYGILLSSIKTYGILFDVTAPPTYGIKFGGVCTDSDISHADKGRTRYGSGWIQGDGSNLTFYDPAIGTKTLSQLAAGGGGMVYPGAGIALSTGSAWDTSITNNSANWNTAYSERRQWDGGNTNLVASTGRSSLALGSAATRNAEDTLSDGSNLPDGHAIKTYGDANWAGGGGGLSNVVEHTTPELGGDLHANAYNIILNSNKNLSGKDSGGTARHLISTSGDTIHVGYGAVGDLYIGHSASGANPAYIRVNSGSYNITRSADTDTAGKHYLVVP